MLAVNTPLAKARFDRAVRRAPRPVKLEIGGHGKRPGWIVTNVNAVARNYLDATVTWPFEDSSISHIYADNVIEHIPLEGTRAMLAEAYRCMQPGGVIRLLTPDIREHVELYLAGAVDGEVGARYRRYGLQVEHPVDLVRIPIASFGHHVGYVFDFDALAAELKRAGFHSTRRCEMNTSDVPEFVGLKPKAEAGMAQLVVEATR